MKNYLRTIFACALVAFFCSCEGEDGAVGPAGEKGQDGINGVDGQDGTNGQDGADGQNGVGFDELVKYGNIKINLSGTRPDGVAFTDQAEFKFTPVDAYDLYNSSYKNILNDTITEYRLQRFLSTPDYTYQNSYALIYLRAINSGEANQSFEFELNLRDYAIVTDDQKYFSISDYYSNEDSYLVNFNITDYNFDEATNNLTFSFSFDVAGSANDTGNDLKVSGEVNTIVLERIIDPRE